MFSFKSIVSFLPFPPKENVIKLSLKNKTTKNLFVSLKIPLFVWVKKNQQTSNQAEHAVLTFLLI